MSLEQNALKVGGADTITSFPPLYDEFVPTQGVGTDADTPIDPASLTVIFSLGGSESRLTLLS
jgi:hypothetical protein